jgi:hypothetical protein
MIFKRQADAYTSACFILLEVLLRELPVHRFPERLNVTGPVVPVVNMEFPVFVLINLPSAYLRKYQQIT